LNSRTHTPTQATNTRALALVGDADANAYELLFSFASFEGKEQFLHLVRTNERDHKVEKVASLRGITPAAGVFGIWFGLATDDTPLVLRGLSSQNIYAFNWTTR
jgi:hypothetical protein